MILDVKRLRSSGKLESAIDFEHNLERELTDNPIYKILSPIKVKGLATLTGKHSVYVEGKITYTLGGSCSRCLEELEKEYEVEFAEEVEDCGDSNYRLVNDKVDLAEIVEDTIITDLPLVFLCSEDCKGICYRCGANLNKEKCKCK